MIFNNHYRLEGTHAFLSPSKSSWLRYDEEKLARVFHTAQSAKRGTELHDLAKELIRLKEKLPKRHRTLNMYVNDAINFRMTPEKILFYSENIYGSADAISFRNDELRIHDLKNGVLQASFDQLMIYAALFCLEYRVRPFELKRIVLRIYQNDEIKELLGDPDEITRTMEHIKMCDKLISQWRLESNL